MPSSTRASDRWPFWLASALALVGALSLIGKSGLLQFVAIGLGVVALLFAIAAACLKDGLLLQRAQSGLLVAMRLGALLICLPELIAQRLPVNWDEQLGVVPPRAECPIFFRMPDMPFEGGRFIKRSGPDQWSGRPLNALLQMKRSCDAAYADETAFAANYDADGFRNAADLKDWDVAIVGDSYVELGTLPDGETIPGQFATMAGLRVKNLGAAATAAQNQAAFLCTFGLAPSCRRAVLVWSEAEIDKTKAEIDRLLAKLSPLPSKTGHSLLHALASRARQLWLPGGGCRTYANATFLSSTGNPVPVTLLPASPHGPTGMGSTPLQTLQKSLAVWAETARSVGMEPWLLFLPTPERVWRDRLSDPPGASDVPAESFPADVAQLCAAAGIHWVDATPALLQASQRGELVFNPIIDHHPTRLGAKLIARTLADAMRAPQLPGPR